MGSGGWWDWILDRQVSWKESIAQHRVDLLKISSNLGISSSLLVRVSVVDFISYGDSPNAPLSELFARVC